jgi:hypothetical protein
VQFTTRLASALRARRLTDGDWQRRASCSSSQRVTGAQAPPLPAPSHPPPASVCLPPASLVPPQSAGPAEHPRWLRHAASRAAFACPQRAWLSHQTGRADPAPAAPRSITRDNLGPYRTKVLVIPAVYFLASLVRSLRRPGLAALGSQRCTGQSHGSEGIANQQHCKLAGRGCTAAVSSIGGSTLDSGTAPQADNDVASSQSGSEQQAAPPAADSLENARRPGRALHHPGRERQPHAGRPHRHHRRGPPHRLGRAHLQRLPGAPLVGRRSPPARCVMRV